MAKIADKITDLSLDNRLEMTEVVEYPIELGWAVESPRGSIFRATIAGVFGFQL